MFLISAFLAFALSSGPSLVFVSADSSRLSANKMKLDKRILQRPKFKMFDQMAMTCHFRSLIRQHE